MDATPNLSLPYIAAAQSQKHVTHNEAIRALDAILQLAVLDRHLTAPPGSPADGARYIVGVSPTGAWSGHAGSIAAYQDGAWMFYTPAEGWIAWIGDEDVAVVWDGAAWSALATGGGGGGGGAGSYTTLGINATADTTNRLTLAADATLLNHDGDGHQLKINKASSADTASMLYQAAFSGRAELGLSGDDDFHFKVSPDGTTWKEAILIDRSTGSVSFPHTSLGGGGGGREVLTANRTYYVRVTGSGGSDSNNGLSTGMPFLTIMKAINVCKTIDFNGFTVTINVGAGSFAGQVTGGVMVGQGSFANLVISGAGSGSTTVTHNGVYEGTFAPDGAGVKYKLQNMTITGTGSGSSGAAVVCFNGAYVNIGADVVIGQTGWFGLLAFGAGAGILLTDGVTFTANTGYAFGGLSGGVLVGNSSQTWAMGTRTLTATLYASNLGLVTLSGVSFSGSVTGSKYTATTNGVISTGGATIPGSAVGTTATGAQVV